MNFEQRDALNVMLRWFGGKMNAADAWVASISTSVIRDLQDGGYVRKRWIGWEITQRGRKALKENNVNSLSDTRLW